MLVVKQKTAYEMRISDWSSDVCSSDLRVGVVGTHLNSLRCSLTSECPGQPANAELPGTRTGGELYHCNSQAPKAQAGARSVRIQVKRRHFVSSHVNRSDKA